VAVDARAQDTKAQDTKAQDTIGAVLTVLRVTRALERIDAGVSPQQYRMLRLIGGGGERSARLAEKLAVARPTLTSIGDSLVAAGLATRQTEPGDRRVVRLCLTPAGQTAVDRADEAYADWFGAVLGHTGQRDQILGALRQVDDAMTERRQARLAADAAGAAGAAAPPVSATGPPGAATATAASGSGHSAGQR
jgi:DNA-binding MarR family transcriptional regulator